MDIKWETVSKELSKPLNNENVRVREGAGRMKLRYIEGWKVIEEANRIFGHGGWSRQLMALDVTTDREREGRRGVLYEVAYRAVVRVTVGDVIRDGVGSGIATLPSHGEAHEMAAKTAETDAMKRAFATFGHPLGLALYDKEGTNIAHDGDHAAQQPQQPSDAQAQATSGGAPGGSAQALDEETRARLASAGKYIRQGFESAATITELEYRYAQAQATLAEMEGHGLSAWVSKLLDVYDARSKELMAKVKDEATAQPPSGEVPMIEPADPPF